MALNVSVVIACRDMGNTLRRAVESALAADAAQVVIIDDASTDNTQIVCSQLMHEHPEVTAVRAANKFRAGVCYARNLGVVVADQPLIVPLDADDTLYPDSLDRMITAYSYKLVVYGGWGERQITKNDSLKITKNFDAPPVGMLSRKNLCHATYLFHKGDWLNAGGYDPAFEIGGEDYALMCALVQNGCKLKRIDGAPLYTRYIAENARTEAATRHWTTVHAMVKERYPLVFHGQPQAP